MEQEKENKENLTPSNKPGIRTYSSDMIKVLEHNQGGLARKIIEDEHKKDIEKKNTSPVSKKNKLFLFFGLILILISFFLLIYFFLANQKLKKAFQEQPSLVLPPIFLDSTLFVKIDNLTKEQIASSLIREQKNNSLKVGNIWGIYLLEEERLVGFQKFMEKIEGGFSQDGYFWMKDDLLFGLVGQNMNQLFLLLSVRSFEDIFLFMNFWERRMFADLYPFFNLQLNNETSELLTKSFTNGIIQNKNARILYDKNGNVVMMYVYVRSDKVLITNNQQTALEIINRLNSSRIKK